MKIKILNNSTNNYIVYNFDFKNHKMNIEENCTNNDFILNMIFKNKNYDEIINWMRSRVGGKQINECIEIARNNNLKNLKDDLLVFIED